MVISSVGKLDGLFLSLSIPACLTMANNVRFVAILVAFGAVFWQLFLRTLLYDGLGIGRVVLPLSDFPYQCQRIEGDPNIQACEDMWMDQKSRILYLACSDSLARKEWMPK
jgi:arylesterase / paraoxonase